MVKRQKPCSSQRDRNCPSFPLLVSTPFLSSADLRAMTFPILSNRTPLWTPSNQTSRHFFPEPVTELPRFPFRPAIFPRLKSLFVVCAVCRFNYVSYSQYTPVCGCLRVGCVGRCVYVWVVWCVCARARMRLEYSLQTRFCAV